MLNRPNLNGNTPFIIFNILKLKVQEFNFLFFLLHFRDLCLDFFLGDPLIFKILLLHLNLNSKITFLLLSDIHNFLQSNRVLLPQLQPNIMQDKNEYFNIGFSKWIYQNFDEIEQNFPIGSFEQEKVQEAVKNVFKLALGCSRIFIFFLE